MCIVHCRREEFVPYGLGRRVCLGEALARDTLIIFFTTLVRSLQAVTSIASYIQYVRIVRCLKEKL